MEKTKFIDYKNRTFVVRKFDALTASYIAFVLFGLLKGAALPGKARRDEAQEQEGAASADGTALSSAITQLDEKTFRGIQLKCLRVTSERRSINGAEVDEPVIKADGTFLKDEDAYDLGLVITITVNSLLFNVQDFFDGGLDGLKKSLEGLTGLQQEL